jgi:hypothetical protein
MCSIACASKSGREGGPFLWRRCGSSRCAGSCDQDRGGAGQCGSVRKGRRNVRAQMSVYRTVPRRRLHLARVRCTVFGRPALAAHFQICEVGSGGASASRRRRGRLCTDIWNGRALLEGLSWKDFGSALNVWVSTQCFTRAFVGRLFPGNSAHSQLKPWTPS